MWCEIRVLAVFHARERTVLASHADSIHPYLTVVGDFTFVPERNLELGCQN
ncbi:hypothetical protein CKA32_001528 [Geitlerinema sp. FC II]|nr:hypothetical protein CKA32_001528 [Geitlerinema sp. FC II]